jgi:hypothetical protein
MMDFSLTLLNLNEKLVAFRKYGDWRLPSTRIAMSRATSKISQTAKRRRVELSSFIGASVR